MDQHNAVQALAALAHENRLSIFRLLVRCGPSGMAAGDIARIVGIGATALSFHLKELAHAGLLRSWRDGRYVRYSVEVDGMRALLGFLTEDCCDGNPELCSAVVAGIPDLCSGRAVEDEMTKDAPYNVLFLCTHNSARSVIAECLMNSLGQGAFVAHSAGSTPRGEINPFAIRILQNHGHKTEGLRSKSWDAFAGPGNDEIDFVYTLCDDAAAESCPVWPGNPITEHWGMRDPSKQEGSDLKKLGAFADTYSLLYHHIDKFVQMAKHDLDARSMRRKVKDFSENVRRQNVMGADGVETET
ncbi:MAG: metalloregulator ArsR/SmtB family transcription factor [Alphaproteobacteria bacterium]|nr:metalloregulator ArsR/SmtB family transcription factor [Alphaproteobacteria bacterium]